MPSLPTYVIGLGANLGSRLATFRAALDLLEGPECRVARLSSVYESEPLGPPQPRYLNAAVRVESQLAPGALLARLHRVETQLGRVRGERWAARSLDLDLLWSDRPVVGGSPRVPHPGLRERWFALQPLLEVAPECWDTHGEDLVRCGGSRPPAARFDRTVGSLRQTVRGREVIEVRAADRPEALASALSALCALSWPVRTGALEVRTEHVCVEPAEQLGVLATRLLAHAAEGFLSRTVTVTACSGSAVDVCFVGGSGRPADLCLEAAEIHTGGTCRAVLEVGRKDR